MLNLNNNYINDYWLKKNIIDCNNITIQTDDLDDFEIIVDDNYTDTYNKKEKLNNKSKINNNYNNKKYDKGRTNKQYSRINKSNITNRNTANNKHIYKKNRENISNNKYNNKEESNKYNKLYNKLNPHNNQKQMYSLPQTSRIYEFKSRERKILLDSFTKNKLDHIT